MNSLQYILLHIPLLANRETLTERIEECAIMPYSNSLTC